MRFASGDRASALAEARHVLQALGDAETEVLFPAFSRVRLRPETQSLLDDSRSGRAEQLAALDALAHKRAARLRKLAVVELCDRIRRYDADEVSLLIPVLSSQLPRPLYRSIVQVFTTRFEGTVETPRAQEPRRTRSVAPSA